MLARAQITIRVERDFEVSATPPPNPAIDTLWMDTSVTPHTMKRWSGSAWVPVGADLANYYTKTELETRFEQTDQAISLKASETAVSALSTRVLAAEQKITPAAIISTVRSNEQYQYDLYHGRNYVLASHETHTFVDNFYRYASGGTTTYTNWSLPVSDDLYAHSKNGTNIRMSFDIKRTGVVASAAGPYTGIWVYYRYMAEDGVTVNTTGRGWLLRGTDTDFVSTDSDFVRMTRGPLNLTAYAPISIAYFMYGTSQSAGTTGTVQFRNVKLEVGNDFTGWSAAPEDLGALPGRVSTAESSITQNANNINLKVSTSLYNSEKVYRSATAPSSPSVGMLWLNTELSPYLLCRWTGSDWVAVGADKVVASGINITPNDIIMRTTNFILQLLDPNNAENVLMDMRADGNVGFKQLFAEEIISNSVVEAYAGSDTLYVNPSYSGTAPNYFKSVREACEFLSGKYLRDTVHITFANSTSEYIYENAGITLKGVCGPGRIWFSFGGKNKTVVGNIFIDSCAIAIFIDGLNIRESRPLNGGSRNPAVVYAHHCTHVTLQHVTVNGNNTSEAAFRADYTNASIWDGALSNVVTGFHMNSNMGVIESTTGTLNYAMLCNAGIIYCVGTVPSGTRATYKNGVIYTTGSSSGGGTNPGAVATEQTATFMASLTRSYRSSVWRSDTSDMVQGAYNDAGYSSSVGWNYGCCWFGTLRTALSGRTVRSATLTISRLTGSGSGSSVYMYLYGITNSTSSGVPALAYNVGAIGFIGRGQTLQINLPLALVQGLVNGTYGGLCLYETPYNFGKSAYSSNYSRYSAPSLYVVYT